MADNEKEILFNLEIQLEDDKTANIIIKESDDIEEVVDQFCQQNEYGDNIKQIILNQIMSELDENINELEAGEYSNQQNDDSNENNGAFDDSEKQTYALTENSYLLNDENNSRTKPDSNNILIMKNPIQEIYIPKNKGYPKVPQTADNATTKKKDTENKILTREESPNLKSNNSFSNFTVDNNKKGAFKSTNYIVELPKQKIQTSPGKSKSNNKSNNKKTMMPGQRLYDQYMEKLPKKRDHSMKIIQERNKSQLKEAKFKPEIDKKSDIMASTSPARKNTKVEDRLLNFGEKKHEKIINEMTKKKLIEYEYTYHPNVSERSQIMATIKRKERLDTIANISSITQNKSINDLSCSKINYDDEIDSDEENRPVVSDKKNVMKKTDKSFISNSANSQSKTLISKDTHNKNNYCNSKINVQIKPDNNIYEYLYAESKLIKEKNEKKKQDMMAKLYPFKPTIHESSKNLIKRSETKEQFIKRLVNSKKVADELIVKLKRKETGKFKDFHPTVGRGPIDPKYREVNVNLDGYYDKKLLFNQTKIKEEETFNNNEKKKLFIENSKNSILKMKIDRYKQIFDVLDSDKDGFISSKNIRLSHLDSDMLKALTPILANLQKFNLEMNFKDFCITADQLFSVKIFPDN